MNWTISGPLEFSSFLDDLCRQTQLNLVEENSDLFFEEGILKFKWENHALYMDFEKELTSFGRSQAGVQNELLAKALGLTKIKDRVVLDATCGMGKDTIRMLTWNCEVHAYERHPVIFCLLRDALRRLEKSDKWARFSKKLSINFGPPAQIPEGVQVIYLDPMYPPKKKSALPKKEMQIFSQLIGKDEDQQDLIDWALGTVCKRVVLKRPDHAPLAFPEKLLHSYKGKTVRYDAYRGKLNE